MRKVRTMHYGEDQIEALLSKMTLREKLGQCVMIEPCFCLAEKNSEGKGPKYTDVLDPAYLDLLLKDYHIGFFLFGGVSRIDDGSPTAWAGYLAKVNEYVKNTRLQIPMMFGIDAVHGVNFMKGSTIYTHNLGVAAAWNPELAKKYASAVGVELSAIGFTSDFAPTIDVARDPRWGRVYESLGEDPYLASQMSKALVEGFQARGDLAACAKHFVGYGESNNGMDRTPADLSERSLLETHAPPFEAAIESGVLTIMVNGGDVNGVPAPASKKLLRDLLRDRMGFTGITLSDWEDVDRLRSRHMVAVDRKDAIARAFNAGLDMNMAVSDLKAVDVMEELVGEGKITLERVDSAVRNILRVKQKLGLFGKEPIAFEKAATFVGSVESKNTAKQLARESMTLLKNDSKLLPLSKKLRSILVTGETATSKSKLCGGWTLGWAGAAEEDLKCATILEAIRGSVSSDTDVVYAADKQELEQLTAGKRTFDVCISVVGEEPHSEWLGDSMSLALEEKEESLLRAAYATSIPVVMVSLVGRPANIRWMAENIPAILWAYLPGTEGAGPVAEVIFGDYNPSGRLPISFPRDANQIPVVYNARRYESGEISTKYEPLYPFGYGLSYTEFQYDHLKVPTSIAVGKNVKISVQVKNIGEVEGEEVVQVYLKDSWASVTRPLRSLKAFKKVSLKAGEEKTVELELGPRQLGLYNEDLQFVQEKREILITIGDKATKCTLV